MYAFKTFFLELYSILTIICLQKPINLYF